MVEDVKDLNDVRVPYVHRAFPRHVHKWNGRDAEGGVKPNLFKEVGDEAALDQALQEGWSKEPVHEEPAEAAPAKRKRGAAVEEPADDEAPEPAAAAAPSTASAPIAPAAAPKAARARKPRSK